MRSEWLNELVPQAGPMAPHGSQRMRTGWLLFFTLFPLAYAGGVMLQWAKESAARIEGAQDRAATIRLAEEFAASKGFEVGGWRQYAAASTKDNLLAYYGNSKAPDIVAARKVAPGREVQVLFRSGDAKHEVRVYLSLSGRVVGYDLDKSSHRKHMTSDLGGLQVHVNEGEKDAGADVPPVQSIAERDAEAIARHALAANEELGNLVKPGVAKVLVNAEDPLRSDVVWDANPPGNQALSMHIDIGVRDAKVVAERFEATVDPKFVPARSKLRIVFMVLYGLFLTVGALYAMYRYAKRTLQKEVSHLRTWVVAALFCVSYSALGYAFAVDQIGIVVSGELFAKVILASYISSILIFGVMGLLVGVAYGSGEGEVREAYVGKLTSLDALLAGRVFSQQVGASILFGAACAGWLLLGQQAIGHLLPGDVAALREDAVHLTFARLPWLTFILGKQYAALLIAVAGLVLPASFLLRSGAVRKSRYAWLIVFAVFSVLHEAAKYPLASALLEIACLVGALLLPFFLSDLLAAIVSLSALSYVNELVRLSALIPSWTIFASGLSGLGAIFVMAATYLALRGRRVASEEVSPRYAKNLAERISMQAEIAAAREAQLRLLPQSAPEIPGMQIAACCLPAHGLGGDFYDFHRLDAKRIGVFVAQGGRQGLASALCIALAKGFLMHASTQSHSPAQIILDLDKSIDELIEGGDAAGISFAYGVIDSERKLLNYARIGAFPRLLIYRHGSGAAASAPLERMIGVGESGGTEHEIYEGSAFLQTGDHLMLFTEGVTSIRPHGFRHRKPKSPDFLMQAVTWQDESLQTSLVSTLGQYQRDSLFDLTAVLVRVRTSEAVAQQVVA